MEDGKQLRLPATTDQLEAKVRKAEAREYEVLKAMEAMEQFLSILRCYLHGCSNQGDYWKCDGCGVDVRQLKRGRKYSDKVEEAMNLTTTRG